MIGAVCSLFICDICDGGFKYHGDLIVHIGNKHEKSHSFICDLCFKWFNRKSNFLHHIRSRHQNIRAFKCQLCSAEYLHKTDLQRHQENIHQGIKFECDDCGQLFGQKNNLSTHIRSVHLEPRQSTIDKHQTGAKHVQCDYCGARFGRRTNLAIHIHSIHIKLSKSKCDQCPAECNFCSHLHRHKQSVDKNKAFICDLCSKIFTDKRRLAAHCLAVHMDLCPFKCSLCGDQFKHLSSLSKHKKHYH